MKQEHCLKKNKKKTATEFYVANFLTSAKDPFNHALKLEKWMFILNLIAIS